MGDQDPHEHGGPSHPALPGSHGIHLSAARPVFIMASVRNEGNGDSSRPPNDHAQQPRELRELGVTVSLDAPTVCCNGWFGPSTAAARATMYSPAANRSSRSEKPPAA